MGVHHHEAALGEDGTATAVMPIFTQMVFDKSDAGNAYTFQSARA